MFKPYTVAAVLALSSVATLPACSSMYGDHTHTVVVTQPELSPGVVRTVQASLQQQGLYKGNVDGVWGPETESAVRGYQRDHGMMATGALNGPTLAALAPSAPPPTAGTPVPPPAPTSLASPPTPAPSTTATTAPTP
jgi:peptidoglycan hydrolase-like protein with peptidoglycan-binding domain